MPVIVVANPKGGVGKSTLATNIAGALARQGHAVMLGDVDRQQSTRHWLKHRPHGVPEIRGWEVSGGDIVRPPKGTTHAVLDTPAGLHNRRLDEVLKIADKLVVPLQPSLFDIEATHAFLREVKAHKRADKVDVGLVGMRAREGFLSTEHLQEFLAVYGITLDLVKVLVFPGDRRMRELISLKAFGLSELDAVRYYTAMIMAEHGVVSAPNMAVGEPFQITGGMPSVSLPLATPAQPVLPNASNADGGRER